MPSCWRHPKEELLLVPVTQAEAANIDEPQCNICEKTFEELENAREGLFTFRHCRCNIRYCRKCAEGAWESVFDDGDEGHGERCFCTICHNHGLPPMDVFPLHADYVGENAAKEIISDYFFARKGAPRFTWESVEIQAVTAPKFVQAMQTYLVNHAGQTSTHNELL
ncbi:hypothetical protein LTR17_014215 [Elasticomyces elasticus]|nr:hypothetical protein LTR17_014215 [Elasticomyces elasticus]